MAALCVMLGVHAEERSTRRTQGWQQVTRTRWNAGRRSMVVVPMLVLVVAAVVLAAAWGVVVTAAR